MVSQRGGQQVGGCTTSCDARTCPRASAAVTKPLPRCVPVCSGWQLGTWHRRGPDVSQTQPITFPAGPTPGSLCILFLASPRARLGHLLPRLQHRWSLPALETGVCPARSRACKIEKSQHFPQNPAISSDPSFKSSLWQWSSHSLTQRLTHPSPLICSFLPKPGPWKAAALPEGIPGGFDHCSLQPG